MAFEDAYPYVPGYHPNPDAKLVLIGEAPADEEVKWNQNFVGSSGVRLREWWKRVGLTRSDFHIINVYPHQAPHNKIEAVPTDVLKRFMEDLHVRIGRIPDPWILIPVGNYALYALTGLGNVKWHRFSGKSRRPGINSHRGSIYEYVDTRGRHMKLIPSIHPAATLPNKSPGLERPCIMDWQRIKTEMAFREINTPKRTHFINPDTTTVSDFHDHVQKLGRDGVLAIDIERPPGYVYTTLKNGKTRKTADYKLGKVVCIGMSFDPSWSIVIPTTLDYWGDPRTLEAIWGLIRQICASSCEKVLQNGLFDTWHLLNHNVVVNRWIWDTLFMHHCLDPSDTHSLAYIASCETREPFWKDMVKGSESPWDWTDDFQRYCGIDACVTLEIQPILETRLRQRNMLPFYLQHYTDLFAPILRMMRHGIQVDDWERRRQQARLMATTITQMMQLKDLTGKDLCGDIDISPMKLQRYLYETLQLPKQMRRRGNKPATVTADEVAVLRLHQMRPETLSKDTCDLVLGIRGNRKLGEHYASDLLDEDLRFRSSYSMNTNGGRLSSSTNPKGSGDNAQNRHRATREMYVADEGYVMVKVDLSQAESRVCFAYIYSLTRNEEILWRAKAHPTEWDEHAENARRIFPGEYDTMDHTSEQWNKLRAIGKMAIHGCQRKLGAQKFSDALLKEGYVVTPEACKEILRSATIAMPGLDTYHRWVDDQMKQTRYLEDAWGGRLYFTYARLDDAAFREGYSFFLQSPVGRIINQWGLLPLDKMLNELPAKVTTGRFFTIGDVNAQVHDELLFSVNPKWAHSVTSKLVDSLEQPLSYNGVELTIPCEITVGMNWKGSTSWKRMPKKEEFDETVAMLVGA